MDKKIIIVALVLLGGAACVYAVTEMDDEELSATDPGTDDDTVIDPPPNMPPMQVDAGTGPALEAPVEPEAALDPIVERQIELGELSRGPSCGSNLCEAGELCCVNTGECVPSSCTDCCRGPEEEMPDPPLVRE